MSTAASKHANPSTRERILTILAVPLIGLALGVPWWIHTTTIERRSLGAVERLRAVGGEVGKVPVYVGGDGAELWVDWMGKCKAESGWELVPREGTSMDPSIQLVNGDDAPYFSNGTLMFPIPGAQRLDHPPSDPTPEDCTGIRSSTAQNTLDQLIPLHPGELPSHALKYTPDVRLSFVLLNEDSTTGGFTDWEISRAINAYIDPLTTALAPFHKFTIESQILHHAPVKFTPEPREEGGRKWWSVSQAQAGVFVNTEQWTLDSGSTNNPVLRFLLFVPREDRRPLVLEDSTAKANGDLPELSTFRIPQFGSVVIPSNPSGSTHQPGHLATPHVRNAFRVFQQDLLELLGVPPIPVFLLRNPDVSIVPNAWQLSALLRTQIRATTTDARGTLLSIQRLVARIQEMRVDRTVVGDVERAVGLLEEAYPIQGRNLALAEVWNRTKHATRLADRAFFNPNMVGLLYFPDEHKYAVYAPLFAPVSVPVVVALVKELKRWRRRRKARAARRHGETRAVEAT